ncbi:hypothetical protein QE152_g14276 [Popillia japonica]|uniref:Uncharacterized protein n=1 Tax=Popillia japonica TaxID=7064 RepID=A0AAW1LB56_POPJA
MSTAHVSNNVWFFLSIHQTTSGLWYVLREFLEVLLGMGNNTIIRPWHLFLASCLETTEHRAQKNVICQGTGEQRTTQSDDEFSIKSRKNNKQLCSKVNEHISLTLLD